MLVGLLPISSGGWLCPIDPRAMTPVRCYLRYPAISPSEEGLAKTVTLLRCSLLCSPGGFHAIRGQLHTSEKVRTTFERQM